MLTCHPFHSNPRGLLRQEYTSFLGETESHRSNCMILFVGISWLHRQSRAADEQPPFGYSDESSRVAPASGKRSFELIPSPENPTRVYAETLATPHPSARPADKDTPNGSPQN